MQFWCLWFYWGFWSSYASDYFSFVMGYTFSLKREELVNLKQKMAVQCREKINILAQEQCNLQLAHTHWHLRERESCTALLSLSSSASLQFSAGSNMNQDSQFFSSYIPTALFGCADCWGWYARTVIYCLVTYVLRHYDIIIISTRTICLLGRLSYIIILVPCKK